MKDPNQEIVHNAKETYDIKWVTLDELENGDYLENVKETARRAFEVLE